MWLNDLHNKIVNLIFNNFFIITSNLFSIIKKIQGKIKRDVLKAVIRNLLKRQAINGKVLFLSWSIN